MFQKPVIQTLILGVVACSIMGCGGGRPTIPTVEVSGTVTMGGQPLEGAEVNLMTDEYAGVATTDASGHYATEAQVGENTVYVSKYDMTDVDPDFDETMVGEGDMPGAGPKQLVPKKYSDPEKTELKFTVPEEGTEAANFDLK